MKKKDRRSITSATNGALGGRPKGFAALEAERQRVLVAEEIAKNWRPIVVRAIKGARAGNKADRQWLYDFAFGKPTQPISTPDGENPFKPSESDVELARKALKVLGAI